MYLTEMEAATGLLDAAAAEHKGEELAAAYRSAAPFPHIVIDDFLPQQLLEVCLAEFGKRQPGQPEYNARQERSKREYHPDLMSPPARGFFYSLNSLPFIRFVENVTGIKGLIPDPYFYGAGFHEIDSGGHLSVHADFNLHKDMRLERRVNLLIYLNEGWKPEYGGQLELWDETMTQCVASIVPELNRCVIFTTTTSSYHGNPEPVRHPDGRSRKSLAMYYYTATWDASKVSHSTLFQERPGGQDRPSWGEKTREIIREVAPPIVLRAAKSVLGGMRSNRPH